MSARRIITAGLMAATIAAGSLAGTTAESRAGSLTPAEAAAIAGIGGLIVGGLIGSSHHGHHGHHHGSSAWQRHVALCHANYLTYDEATDSYMGYDGHRHRCNIW